MKCQSCTNPATVHLTDIINGHKRELHLCQRCAEKQQLLKKNDINLSAILQTLMGQYVGAPTDALAQLTCPACGMKFMEFRAEGQLGCPHDYEVFRDGLGPLLYHFHRANKHVGKVPRHRRLTIQNQAEQIELRRRLREAVESEAYEEAARIRDLLRQKEAVDDSQPR